MNFRNSVPSRQDIVTSALRRALTEATDLIADLHGLSPKQVPNLRRPRTMAVREALNNLANDPEFTEAVATLHLPRECARVSCTNTVKGSARWCGAACRQWGKRQRASRRHTAE